MCHVYLVTQSCPTLYDPMDCSPPSSSLHADSPGKNTGVGFHAHLKMHHKQAQRPFARCYMFFLLPFHTSFLLFSLFIFLNNFLYNCKRLEEAHIIKAEYKSVTKI